jgi:hypothetical protein
MIKKIFTITLILIASTGLIQAQVLSSFPTEKDKFIKAVDEMMKASRSEALAKTNEEFNKNVTDTGDHNDCQYHGAAKPAAISLL